MPGPAFQEDPELLAAVGGGGAQPFQEDNELLQALQAPRGAAVYSEPDPTPLPEKESLMQSLLGRYAESKQLEQQTAPTPDQMQGAAGALVGGLTHGVYSPWKDQQAALPPVVRGVYNGTGSIVSPINKLAIAAPGATPLAAGLRTGAVLGAEGGARRAVNDPNATAGDVAGDVVRNGAGGFLFGAGAQGIANRFAGAADTAGEVADSARVRASGVPANQAADMGAPARAELAQKLEDPANGLITRPFQSPAGYLANAKNLQARGGAQMAAAEDAIAGMPAAPNVPVDDIIAAQRARAAQSQSLIDPANAAPIGLRNQLANNLEAATTRVVRPPMTDAQRFEALSKPGYQPPPPTSGQMPWQEALANRRDLDARINYGAAPGAESEASGIRSEVADGLRANIDRSLNSPNVPPEVAQQWRTGRDAFSLGSDVRGSSFKAIPNTNVPARTTEVPGFLARSGGMSAIAGGARAAQGGLGAASEDAPQVAQQALQGWLASKGVNAQAPANNQSSSSSSTGGQSGQRALQALQVNPAMLGKWAPQFEEAQRTGGEEAVNALINKLVLGSDPDSVAFRTGPYQQLSRGQNGQ